MVSRFQILWSYLTAGIVYTVGEGNSENGAIVIFSDCYNLLFNDFSKTIEINLMEI